MVVDSGSRQVIDAPPAVAPIYSLVTAARLVDDGVRWQKGVIWSPEQVSGGGAVSLDCHGDTPGGKPTGHNPVRNTADPFVVFAEDHCSTLGFEARDFEGRARRQIAAVQSSHIAHEFQFGIIRDAEGLNNVALVDAIEIGPGSQPIDKALGILEAAIAEKFNGAQAMVHLPMQAFVAAAAQHLIYQSGQKWFTFPGNIVVPDAGYRAETTPESAVYAYATTVVEIRLSPVDIIPGSFDEALARAQMTDRARNLIVIRAERLALVQFDHTDVDPADLVFKIELDLPPWHAGS